YLAMSIPGFVFLFLNNINFLLLKYFSALAVIFLTFSSSAVHSLWIDGQPYGSSVFFLLCATGVTYIKFGRVVVPGIALVFAAFVFATCALFINIGLFILAFPLSLGAAVLQPKKENTLFCILLVVAFALNVFFANRFGGNYTGIYETFRFSTHNI